MRPTRFLALALLVGCGRGEGRAHVCECSFLTDFDDPSHVVVEACAGSAVEANDVARSCAQSGAPAPVERCTCAPSPSNSACPEGQCSVR